MPSSGEHLFCEVQADIEKFLEHEESIIDFIMKLLLRIEYQIQKWGIKNALCISLESDYLPNDVET